ncbi:MAG: hypothetical protein ABWY63_10140 [Hyphomicrobiaceae bacterium]
MTLADLIGEPWILAQPGILLRSLQDEMFRISGFAVPSAKVEMESLHLYMRLNRNEGLGRTLSLPWPCVFGAKGTRITILAAKA